MTKPSEASLDIEEEENYRVWMTSRSFRFQIWAKSREFAIFTTELRVFLVYRTGSFPSVGPDQERSPVFRMEPMMGQNLGLHTRKLLDSCSYQADHFQANMSTSVPARSTFNLTIGSAWLSTESGDRDGRVCLPQHEHYQTREYARTAACDGLDTWSVSEQRSKHTRKL